MFVTWTYREEMEGLARRLIRYYKTKVLYYYIVPMRKRQ